MTVTATSLSPGVQARPAESEQFATIRDPLRISIGVLIVLAVSRIHQQFPAIAALRPALLFTLAVMVYAFLNPRSLSSESIFRTFPAKVFALLAIIATLSVPFGISLGNSGRFIWEGYWKTLIFAFVMIAACRSARDLYTYVWSYAIGAALLSYLAIFVFKLTHYTGEISYARLSGLSTYDANDIGCVLLPGLVFTLLALQTTKVVWQKVTCVVVLLSIMAALGRGGSRGTFLGMIAVGVMLLLFIGSVSVFKRVLLVAVASGALAVGAPSGYFDQMATMLDTKDYNYNSIDGRKALAKRGMEYMWRFPIFGLGINNFQKAECTISSKVHTQKGTKGIIRCTPPHNSYVQAGAETGLGGFIVWPSLLVFGIIGPFRLRRKLPRSWAKGTDEQRFLVGACQYLPAAFVGFAVTAYFLSFAWMDIYYMLGAYLSALYLSVDAARQRASGASPAVGPPASHGPPSLAPVRGNVFVGRQRLRSRFPS